MGLSAEYRAHFRALRELSGLSREEIAQAISVTPQTIDQWCSGIIIPKEEGMRFLIQKDEELSEIASEVCDQIAEMVEDRGEEPHHIVVHSYHHNETYDESPLWDKTDLTFGQHWELQKRLYCLLNHEGYDVLVGESTGDDGEEHHVSVVFTFDDIIYI
ncbi:MAG: helix-turn-helix transcriptional regulator [Corynebacteriales bacterium]|nr:helix-turn-helix transcriptional regulator [Mycobacteriales bacterium]